MVCMVCVCPYAPMRTLLQWFKQKKKPPSRWLVCGVDSLLQTMDIVFYPGYFMDRELRAPSYGFIRLVLVQSD